MSSISPASSPTRRIIGASNTSAPAPTNAGDAADNANPAGDGIANLLKYSLGLNPQIAYRPGTAIATGSRLPPATSR